MALPPPVAPASTTDSSTCAGSTPAIRGRARLLLGLVTGRLGRSPVYRQWVTTSLHVRSLDGPMRLARDGETFDGPIEIEVAKTGERIALYGVSRGSA